MSSTIVDSLVLDLLEWIGTGRPYPEVLDAWRTSCPRLPVWEEANDSGFVCASRRPGSEQLVTVSPSGRAHLAAHRPGAAVPPAGRAGAPGGR